MKPSPVPPAIAQQLRDAVATLDKATGVPVWVIRAYVWARHQGVAAVERVCAAHYGVNWRAETNPVITGEDGARWVRRLDAARVTVPLARRAA